MDWPTSRLDGRVAIVTGAAGALGAMAARAYAAAGARVVLADLRAEPLEAALRPIRDAGGDALSVVADVTDEADVAHLVERTVDAYGTVDVLLNNAGVITSNTMRESTADEWRRVFEVNVIGTLLPTQACARVMIERRYGRIVNLSSALARTSVAQRCAYAATKAAVSNMTQSFAVELGPHGITVNAIAPTAVITDLNRALVERQPAVYEALLGSTPLGRFCETADLVGALTLLASEASAFITAQTLYIDGGFSVV